jgi:hypothetical protein
MRVFFPQRFATAGAWRRLLANRFPDDLLFHVTRDLHTRLVDEVLGILIRAPK